jgi:hypothetical protein
MKGAPVVEIVDIGNMLTLERNWKHAKGWETEESACSLDNTSLHEEVGLQRSPGGGGARNALQQGAHRVGVENFCQGTTLKQTPDSNSREGGGCGGLRCSWQCYGNAHFMGGIHLSTTACIHTTRTGFWHRSHKVMADDSKQVRIKAKKGMQ